MKNILFCHVWRINYSFIPWSQKNIADIKQDDDKMICMQANFPLFGLRWFNLRELVSLTPRVPSESKHRGQRWPLGLFSFEEDKGGEVAVENGLVGGFLKVCRMLRARCNAATPPRTRKTGPVFFSAPASSSSSSTLFTYSMPSSLFAKW